MQQIHHLKASNPPLNGSSFVSQGAPVLTGAYSSFTGVYAPYFSSTGLTVNGTEYKTPVPAARFGTFGTN